MSLVKLAAEEVEKKKKRRAKMVAMAAIPVGLALPFAYSDLFRRKGKTPQGRIPALPAPAPRPR